MSSYGEENKNSTVTPLVSYMCNPYCKENASVDIIVKMPRNSTVASMPIQLMFVRFDGMYQSYIYVIGSYMLNYSSPLRVVAKAPSEKGIYGVMASIMGG